MVRPSLFAVVVQALLFGLGCAPDFEPASTLDSVRVLGVQKDKPYARPGDTVTLRMLVTDATPSGARPIEIIWLGGFCEHPPGDLYLRCFDQFVPKPGDPPFTGEFGLPDTILQGTGPVFKLPLSRDIISGRPPPVNRRQRPYGVSFVFFTACAGNLGIAPEGETLPFACYNSTSGERLGPSAFVAGYTEVFASNTITNANPLVTGFEVDDQKVATDCTGAACIPPEEASLGGDAGLPRGAAPSGAGGLDAALADAGVIDAGSGAAPGVDAGGFRLPEADPCDATSPSAACIDVCTKEKQNDCPKHSIKLLVDPESAEIDGVAKELEGHDVFEQGWINYYTDGGKIPIEVKLLSDATLGFHEGHATNILAPRKKGLFHVWAVAHDNRGGTEWVRVRMSAH
jgi:hypothetical protein